MDDNILFQTFITNVARVTVPRARNEILQFLPNFRSLLGTSEKEIDNFVKSTHSSNSARANNARILIPTTATLALKAVLFELKDRQLCDALPTATMLAALDAEQVSQLRNQRNQYIQDQSQESDNPLSSMDIPKLTTSNYESFITAFQSLASRTKGASGVTLDYLMRTQNGNYETPWVSRDERLKNCCRLNGPRFVRDREVLYSLFVEYVGSDGIGSDIVNRFKQTKNGYACYHAFQAHFRSESFLENKASAATQAISNAVYKGDRQHFTLENYYSIMAKAFNDLSQAGPAHSLSEQQKITKFEGGLRDEKAISWAITAKIQWNQLPPAEQTFDSFFNEFSKYMSKMKTLTGSTSRTSRISAFGTGRGRGGRGRGSRGGGRGRRGRGRGRRGRGSRYNPYSFIPPTGGSFQPEAKVYGSAEWGNLDSHQRQAVTNIKIQNGWINGQTPPAGCVLDQHGYAVASTTLVAAVQRSIAAASTAPSLPPAPSNPVALSPPTMSARGVPPIINTSASTAGNTFGRSGTRISSDSVSQISQVSINGQTYNGPLFDANHNRIA